MSKEKRPPEEEGNGYLEIDLSGLKDKVDDGIERLVYGNVSRKFDGSKPKGQGRLGLDPIFAKASVVCLILVLLVFLCGVLFSADADLLVFFGFMMLLCLLLMVVSFYEIRFDKKGFTIRFGKMILRTHTWSDVTDVRDGKKVYVRGKRLWTDHTLDDFKEFYQLARVACKGAGKPTKPSEKKRKNRKKQNSSSIPS